MPLEMALERELDGAGERGDRILDWACLAGRSLLENGAETYRVEDTVNRIAAAYGL